MKRFYNIVGIASAFVAAAALFYAGARIADAAEPNAERAREPIDAPELPPGVIIDKSADFQTIYVGSPSFEILPDGTYVASHEWFGPRTPEVGTIVFASSDKGATWKRIGFIPRQCASMLFFNRGALYAFGWTAGENADSMEGRRISISRSDDGGATWTTPTDSKSGILLGDGDPSYFCDPAPVLFHNGRVWKEVELIGAPDPNSPRNWATQFSPIVASAPDDSDLLDASNWTFSNPVRWQTTPGLGGWCEGNVLCDPTTGKTIVQMRVDDVKYCGKGAQIQVSDDGTKAEFDPKTGFIAMPGGCKKFVIRFDEKSGKYWSLVNWVHPDDVDAPDKERTRNTLALVCSDDLKNWEIRTIVFRRLDLGIGFQYCDWRVEGDDLVFVCRLAWTGAHNCHDANYFTFHRLNNFRNLTRADDATPWR